MEKFEVGNEEDTDTLIRMPENLEKVEKLCLVLKNYKEEEAKDPSSLDIKYESAILRGVLSKGITSYNELLKEISPENKAVFNKAFDVILSYTIN